MTEPKYAVEDGDASTPEYVTVGDPAPSLPVGGAGEAPEAVAKLSDSVLCVRYKGSANQRSLSAIDLSGVGSAAPEFLVWTPESEVPWEDWLRLAGSEERARQVLKDMVHDFELVGPGAEADAAEEFEVGGSVE